MARYSYGLAAHKRIVAKIVAEDFPASRDHRAFLKALAEEGFSDSSSVIRMAMNLLEEHGPSWLLSGIAASSLYELLDLRSQVRRFSYSLGAMFDTARVDPPWKEDQP